MVDESSIEYAAFNVDERPQVYWDWDLSKKNIDFLKGINSKYFLHAICANEPHLKGESKQQAALALRLAYFQGLETLFALMCAAFQSPKCIIGWMLSYKNDNLVSLTNKITNGLECKVHPLMRPVSWGAMANNVLSCTSCSDEQKHVMENGFTLLWDRFARAFLEEGTTQEYNSIKHGTRICPGGFTLKVGLETTYGASPGAEDMHTLCNSSFGSRYYTAEKIDGSKSIHFRPRLNARNWIPENLISSIELIASSIQNLSSFLRIIGGDKPSDCEFYIISDAEAFKTPWKRSVRVKSMNLDTLVQKSDVTLWNKNEIEALIETNHKE